MITYYKIVFKSFRLNVNNISKIISSDSPNVNINHKKRAGRLLTISIEAKELNEIMLLQKKEIGLTLGMLL